jgi:hypothetical protein
MTKEEFIIAYSQGYVGDNEHLERRLAAIASKVFDALNPPVIALTDNATLTAGQSSSIVTIATDAKVITLPAAADGLTYTVVNKGADGAVLVSIDTSGTESIFGTTTASTNVVIPGGAGKKLLNTKATAIKGDNVTLKGVAGVGWFIVGCHGIWAAEA